MLWFSKQNSNTDITLFYADWFHVKPIRETISLFKFIKTLISNQHAMEH